MKRVGRGNCSLADKFANIVLAFSFVKHNLLHPFSDNINTGYLVAEKITKLKQFTRIKSKSVPFSRF